MGTIDHSFQKYTFVILMDIAELPCKELAGLLYSSPQQCMTEPFFPHLANIVTLTILILANLNRFKMTI